MNYKLNTTHMVVFQFYIYNKLLLNKIHIYNTGYDMQVIDTTKKTI